ncbi:response regulator [Streptomyces sp. NPDC052494]|uniref:response regulator transcription factor n=1 Tax=Streptomyces sp. NPDC052494 TaxID=3365692 RepID=UPI0037D17D5B
MRVVIAEDSALLRQGIVLLLEEQGIDVVDAVGDGEALLRSVAEHQPDVCVVDVRMPPTFVDEGLRAALVIRNRWPDIGVLVLSQYVEQSYAIDLIDSATSGVGYLLKDRVSDVDEFVAALDRVTAGDTVLDPEVVKQMLARSRRQDPMATLSPRERDVLAAMAEGRSNGGIATLLVIGSAAVEKHIRSIFLKFGLHPEDGEHRRVLAVLRYLGA